MSLELTMLLFVVRPLVVEMERFRERFEFAWFEICLAREEGTRWRVDGAGERSLRFLPPT